MIRAVIDTNVLVSGLIRATGNEALVLLAVSHRLVRPCFSPAILDEYAAVLARPKFDFPPNQITAVLAMLHANGEMIEPNPSQFASPDADDTKFIDCALAADADFLVTGNKRHFPLGQYGSARVISAGELLARVAREI